MNLPVAKIRLEAGVPVVNSRDVADHFEKRHDHVLRDIGTLVTDPKVGVSGWFRQATYIDTTGRTLPSYDLTRDGFTLLVMGWTGERALIFKITYIEAFNAMEAQIKSTIPVTMHTQLVSALREAVAPIAVRFDHQDVKIARIETRVERVEGLASELNIKIDTIGARRRRISEKTKSEHLAAVRKLGCRCPCCGEVEIVDASGQLLPDAEFDHFYASSWPTAEHTWLICKKRCHRKLTSGQIKRPDVEAHFRTYQARRERFNYPLLHLF